MKWKKKKKGILDFKFQEFRNFVIFRIMIS